MNRLAEEIVPLAFNTACRRAIWPTSRSPESVKATTDGVVREPSALGMTVGWPPSMAAMTELVVPRSMPTALAIGPPHGVGADGRSRAGGVTHPPAQVCFVRFMGSFRRPRRVYVTRTGDLGRACRTPRWHVHPEIGVRGVG